MDDSEYENRPRQGFSINVIGIIAAVILTTAVAAVILKLHARCATRRQQAAAANSNLSLVATGEPGLDPACIAAIPSFAYCKSTMGEEALVECAVCLSRFEEEEMVRAIPSCMHIYHEKCIDLWLQSHSTCPICRVQALCQA